MYGVDVTLRFCECGGELTGELDAWNARDVRTVHSFHVVAGRELMCACAGLDHIVRVL